MEVRFYATLRDITGAGRVDFGLHPGATVRDLLCAAVERFPALGPLAWTPEGELNDFIKVFVDGREIRYLKGLATVIAEGAPVDIFPPAAGG
ncbi:MAG: MoaD/ThiS family protein [Dehalococcoidia bacterium]|nr:MAG: MoaD/ThiS family protein [bacterium]MCE7928683.1 MoaD/ThiS family protein [Chloroflexi bacterium CFX7]MCK6565376.1 MoaD/ThiS family protein [Dehalococcoidia bacterium]MCL4231308.1 MoaD/ThiS family protein [Dehalococcoidia bacterium]NUQ56281.1 MoaD/ThiS family protein [Dehalococcoidia bacterium]